MPSLAMAGISSLSSAEFMAAQEAMAAQQRAEQLATTMIQMQNARNAALCNMMLDGVKVINALMKKGGAAEDAAIGQ